MVLKFLGREQVILGRLTEPCFQQVTGVDHIAACYCLHLLDPNQLENEALLDF